MRELSAMRHQERGKGRPVLFVNGQFQARDSWDPTVAQLSRFCQTLTFEFPNQGRSATASEMDTMDHYGRFTLAYFERLGLDPAECVVHGYSFGGNVARYMHLEMGVDFHALVMFGVGSHRLAEFQLRRLATWRELLDKGELELFTTVMMLQAFSPEFVSSHSRHFDIIKSAFTGYYRQRPEAVVALVKALEHHFKVQRPQGDRYRCPVHFIGASADLLTPWHYVEQYASETGGLSADCLAGGHQTRVEHHQPYVDLLTRLVMPYV